MPVVARLQPDTQADGTTPWSDVCRTGVAYRSASRIMEPNWQGRPADRASLGVVRHAIRGAKELRMSGRTAETASLEILDKERVLHPATSIADHLRTGPRIMAEGSVLTLTDVEGRRYLDAVAGLWCVNIGYGRTEVADAMAAQARRLAYYHTFSSMSNEPQIRLADRLLGIVPGRMSKVFFANSGSEAN